MDEKKRDMQKLGSALLALGIILTLSGALYPFATVIFVTPSLNLSPAFPAGSQSNPTPLSPGNIVGLICYISMLDVGTPTSMTCHITGSGYDVTVDLHWVHKTDYDEMSGTWTVPNVAEQTTLSFYWLCETSGGYSADAITYGRIGVPDGIFYINDEEATLTSVHTVYDPTIEFKFVATHLPEKITMVHVYVTGTESWTVTMTKVTADTWTGTFTLPNRGQYTVDGFISDGTNTFHLMSIMGDWFPESPVTWQNVLILSGVGLIICGYYVDRKRKKR